MKRFNSRSDPGIIWIITVCLIVFQTTHAAPVYEEDDSDHSQQSQLQEYDDESPEEIGCYYNFQHYNEGDRIVTNEPCLNCTCHNRMLMCYLRVCPFTKAIGQDCTIEKKPEQCCPVITCPEVPVQLLTSSTTTELPDTPTPHQTALGHPDNYGCTMDDAFFTDGAQVPSNPDEPCELCYCIRNRTACVMQECTLRVEGCRPVYQNGVCCPVRYDCDYDEEVAITTTERPRVTPGLVLTTTTPGPLDCHYNEDVYADGASIATEQPCEHCYCMRGEIVCAVVECGTPLDKENCTALPPPPGKCCPENYNCDDNEIEDETEPTSRQDRKHKDDNQTLSEHTTRALEAEPTTLPTDLSQSSSESSHESTEQAETQSPLHVNEIPSHDDEQHSPVTDHELEEATHATERPEEVTSNDVTHTEVHIPTEAHEVSEESVHETEPSPVEFEHEGDQTEASTESVKVDKVNEEEPTQTSVADVDSSTPQSELEKEKGVSTSEPTVSENEEPIMVTEGISPPHLPIESDSHLMDEEFGSSPIHHDEIYHAMETTTPRKLEEPLTEGDIKEVSEASSSEESHTTESELDEHVHTSSQEPEVPEHITHEHSTEAGVEEESTEKQYSTQQAEEGTEVSHDPESPVQEEVTPSVSDIPSEETSEPEEPGHVTEHEPETDKLVTTVRSVESTEPGSEPETGDDVEQGVPSIEPEIELTTHVVESEPDVEPSGEPEPEIQATSEPDSGKDNVTPPSETETESTSHLSETEVTSHSDESENEVETTPESNQPEHEVESTSHHSEPENDFESTSLANEQEHETGSTSVASEPEDEVEPISHTSETEQEVESTSVSSEAEAEVQPTSDVSEVGQEKDYTTPVNELEPEVEQSATSSEPETEAESASPASEAEPTTRHYDEPSDYNTEENVSEVTEVTNEAALDESNAEEHTEEPILTHQPESSDEPEVTTPEPQAETEDDKNIPEEVETQAPEEDSYAPVENDISSEPENEPTTPEAIAHEEHEAPTTEKFSEVTSHDEVEPELPEKSSVTEEIPEGTEESDKETSENYTEGSVEPQASTEADEPAPEVPHEDDIPVGAITEKAEELTSAPVDDIQPEVVTEKDEGSYPTTTAREISSTEFIPHGIIPGEGNCLIDGTSYKNNSHIDPINPCQISCRCVSSIVHCVLVTCPPPPPGMADCAPISHGENSCCPTYTCNGEKQSTLESDSHLAETESSVPEEAHTENDIQNEVFESTTKSEVVQETSSQEQEPETSPQYSSPIETTPRLLYEETTSSSEIEENKPQPVEPEIETEASPEVEVHTSTSTEQINEVENDIETEEPGPSTAPVQDSENTSESVETESPVYEASTEEVKQTQEDIQPEITTEQQSESVPSGAEEVSHAPEDETTSSVYEESTEKLLTSDQSLSTHEEDISESPQTESHSEISTESDVTPETDKSVSSEALTEANEADKPTEESTSHETSTPRKIEEYETTITILSSPEIDASVYNDEVSSTSPVLDEDVTDAVTEKEVETSEEPAEEIATENDLSSSEETTTVRLEPHPEPEEDEKQATTALPSHEESSISVVTEEEGAVEPITTEVSSNDVSEEPEHEASTEHIHELTEHAATDSLPPRVGEEVQQSTEVPEEQTTSHSSPIGSQDVTEGVKDTSSVEPIPIENLETEEPATSTQRDHVSTETTTRSAEVSTQGLDVVGQPETGYEYQKPDKPFEEEPPKPATDEEVHPYDEEEFQHGTNTGYLPQHEDYDEEPEQPYGPGTCRYAGKVYVSAQQIPRDDPCDFCFCFRSDIICLQQSCPPPIPGCHEEPIQGFCCPRYECHVKMATMLNVTTTTTTTTTALPPHFMAHAYKGAAARTGCLVQGRSYRVGQAILSASGPCMDCICGGDGQMKCEPKICTPEPMLRKMMVTAGTPLSMSRKR